jgi:hypothetical protein
LGESWVVNASPVITLAKAGYLHLFDQLSQEILIPRPVIEEILAGPPSDPARKAAESGWGHPVSPGPIPDLVLLASPILRTWTLNPTIPCLILLRKDPGSTQIGRSGTKGVHGAGTKPWSAMGEPQRRSK